MNEPLDQSAAGGAALFDEKSFYLEEFYGKSLLLALIPPSGERVGELDPLVRTLRELRRNQARCIVIVPADALARIVRRLGRLAPRAEPQFLIPAPGRRWRFPSAGFGGRSNLARAECGDQSWWRPPTP